MDHNSGTVRRQIKLLVTSDTHGKLDELQKVVDQGITGDIFVHCGDFTWYNKREHFNAFVALLGSLQFRHKLLVPGNHEILLDPDFTD